MGRGYGEGRAGRRGLQGLVLLGALLVLLLFGGAGPASAHAALRDSDPGDGVVLKSAPRDITLTFTESVGLLDDSFRVLDPENQRVKIGDAEHGQGGSRTAGVTLPAKLATGTYTVAWRVVSADSHPVAGAFTFSIGKPSATTATIDTGPVENPATASLYNILRYGAYLAVALLIGPLVFIAACRPKDPGPLRRPLVAAWWTLVATTVALLVLRGPYETGTGPETAFDSGALTRTLTGRPGVALLVRLALLLAVAVLVRLQGRGAVLNLRLPPRGRDQPPPADSQRTTYPAKYWAPGTALAIALALTWASAEHASAGIQVPVAITSSVLHLLAMSVWLGGLTALLITLYRSPTADPLPATRFSKLALTSVTVLVITGVYQSWRGLGSWSALTETTYGRLLTVKLIAVVLLLAAAAYSRRWTTASLVTADAEAAVRERVPEPAGGPPLPKPEAPAPAPVDARALRRSVLAEVALGVVVLVITSVLTGTLPGRAAAEAAEAAPATGLPAASVTVVPFDVGTPGGRGKVQITLDAGRVGENTVEAVVFGADGGIATVPELRLSFTLASQDIGPLDAKVTDKGGYWGTSSLNLPIAGTWTMKVTIRVSDIDQVTETKSVVIR